MDTLRMWSDYLIGAVILNAASGVPGIFLGRRRMFGQWLATALVVSGCACGMFPALAALLAGARPGFTLRGPLPETILQFHLDALGSFFLVPILLVGAAGSIYGLSYWRQDEHPRSGRRLGFCYGLLIAALALVVMAGDAVAFLFAWEVMALFAFLLVCTEVHKKEARDAGWLYLVSTHIGTLSLFALFALWRTASGSFEFQPLEPGQAGLGMRWAMFLMALSGFGLKAGMMPLHFWLPSAHAAAPSHVSAILSGVMLKVGIYGLMRTFTLIPEPPMSWGGLVLLLGTISAVVGVLFAIGQHDLKRLLAYHSIENIGIILIGLGLALIGESRGRPEWVVLGLAGCLLHVWNHALFKSLLFLAAGAVVHSAGTRQIDQMGGLAKAMPRTAVLFLIGAVAICGLPPLNGFVSEFFIYLGLFRSLDGASGAAVAVPALALTGALALACFVKALGAVFCGVARREGSIEHARLHESSPIMLLPMAILAACCLTIGLCPFLIVRPLRSVIEQWNGAHSPGIDELVPLATLTRMGLMLVGVILLGAIGLSWWTQIRRLKQRSAATWGCGYALPTARMQYTASSFASTLVLLFRRVLRPHSHEPTIPPPFPATTEFESHIEDVVLEGFLNPLWSRVRSSLGWLRLLQHGGVQAYVLYILIVLSVLLLLTMPVITMLKSFIGGG